MSIGCHSERSEESSEAQLCGFRLDPSGFALRMTYYLNTNMFHLMFNHAIIVNNARHNDRGK